MHAPHAHSFLSLSLSPFPPLLSCSVCQQLDLLSIHNSAGKAHSHIPQNPSPTAPTSIRCPPTPSLVTLIMHWGWSIARPGDSVVLTFSSWWWSERHWRERGSSSCGWKPSRCWAPRGRLPARRASSATVMTRPEEMAAETQSRLALQQRSAQHFCPGVCLPPTLILPNSICFWMVYICSVLSILLAPSLQLLTNCWSNHHNSHIRILPFPDFKALFAAGEPLSTSLPCSWRSAPTRRQSTRLSCPLFSGILSARGRGQEVYLVKAVEKLVSWRRRRRKGKPTSSSSGSLVTLCMGRMRKEIMGRPPHSLLPSICFRLSLKAALLALTEEQLRVTLSFVLAGTLGYSQQLLQRPLLERLVGAIDDVGFKMIGSVVLNDVADVPYDWILIVTPFQVLKKTGKKWEWRFCYNTTSIFFFFANVKFYESEIHNFN